MKLSIVIPAYNEEHRLGVMLDAYLPYFETKYGAAVEFIVVANGCRDRTAELAQSYAARHAALRVIVEPAAIGKGGAVIRGFDAARGDLMGFVDADGATPPAAFDALVESIGPAGMIIANRWHPESHITRQPWFRRFASRCFNGLVRGWFRLPTSDTQCGAKLLRREAYAAIRPALGLTQWAFDVDLLFQARRAGWDIREIPTVWHDIGGSHLKMVKAPLEMLIAITRLRLMYSRHFHWVVAFYDRTLGHVTHRPRGRP